MKPTRIHTLNIRIRFVKIIFLVAGILILQSCKDQEEYILEAELLQGSWVEVEPESLGQFAGSTHTFTFSTDSFFLKTSYWTDVVFPGDTCEACPKYSYSKGEYAFDATTITFNGIRGMNSDYSGPADTSLLSTYHLSYKYKLETLYKLVLNPDSEYESITLVKN